MSKGKRRQLDTLLRRWAASREPDEVALAKLQQRILARWAEEPTAGGDQASLARPGAAHRSARRVKLAAAAAALIALAAITGGLAVFLAKDGEVSSGPPRERPPAVPADLETTRTAALKSVFAEAEWLFDGQLAWVAETAEQVRLGLTEDRAPADEPRTVAVRLAILRQREAGSAWIPVWWVDVICRPEVVVRVSEDGRLEHLYVWAYLLPDGMVAVDTELAAEGPVPIRAAQSELYQPDVPKLLAAKTHSGAEFRVMQTVTVLDRRGGHSG